VIANICEQLESGAAHTTAITGVMIESHLNAGRQDVPAEGPAALKHGVSITDACVEWDSTVEMLDALNAVSSVSHLNLHHHHC
jgi:3-deoxy-7-phosphoheptulonate synthase